MGDSARELKIRTAIAVQEIYRPVLRGYFALFALYYLVMLPTHIAYFSGLTLIVMGGVAALAAVSALFGVWMMRKPHPLGQIEVALITLNLLVVANIVIALQIEFEREKLVYFVIIAVGFALASASMRQALISLMPAAIGLAIFVFALSGEDLRIYAFISVGAAIASFGIAWLIRRAITSIANAKIKAEDDLEDARTLSEKLERQSRSDSLTGLPNRRAFFANIREVLGGLQANPEGKQFWLLLLDLDGFKSVNDVHGHLTGDLLLKEVADRLRSFADKGIAVSRMGGDEFNIVLPVNADNGSVLGHCEKLLASLSVPYQIEDRTVRISASIGGRKLDPDQSMREQINQADFALMFAKKQGRNQAILFNGELAVKAKERSLIEQALRRADFDKELSLAFQPQFNLNSNLIVRAEVLARWTSRDHVEPVDPEQFIRIAEECGIITDITLAMVDKTFQEISGWPVKLPVSINLSSHDIISKPTIESIIEKADQYQIDPATVEFEVTETAMMADVEKAIVHLEMLGDKGFSIALDDFGTGYSNFSYLRSLPISKLKIDRSFLENPGDPMTEKILSSLAGMARILGVHCLFEGIEDEIGLLMAKRAGAETVQGYLFGRPMSAEELLAKLCDASLVELAAKAPATRPELVFDKNSPAHV